MNNGSSYLGALSKWVSEGIWHKRCPWGGYEEKVRRVFRTF